MATGSGFTNPSSDKWYSRDYAKEINQMNIYNGFDLTILDEFVRVLKKINIYLFCSKEQVLPLLKYFVDGKGCKFEILIWQKTNPSPFFNGTYLNDKEYCLFFKEAGVPLNTDYDSSKTIFVTSVNKADKELYEHPTIKPEPIVETLLKNSCQEGGLVFDPFSGSGTTCAVAKRLGMRYLGFEISERYWKISKDRLDGITQRERKANIEQLKLF